MKIAVSACLLGESVRFDGGHKHDRFITDELGQLAEFIPFCPEHLAFGTPRPSVRLMRQDEKIHVHSNKNGTDLTEQLFHACRNELNRLNPYPISGIIFKSKSPSCGMKSAKLYLENGMCEGKEDGLFAALCRERYPLLPMEEEGRLQDPWLRENFIMQLFAYNDFEQFKSANPSPGELIRFHTTRKFMLQSKDEKMYRALGNIVANHEHYDFEIQIALYETLYKTAIAQKSSIKRNRNVLEHMAGFLKNHLSKIEKEVLHTQFAEYAEKIVPLIVPLSTIALYAAHYQVDYLLEQTFLNPYPKTLALRSHIDAGK